MNIRLEKIAKELLIEEDFVIIPEFGGFITHYRPAFIEPNKNVILPPGKSISFNSKLSKNDGLLAQHVSLKTGLSYNDSLTAIQSKILYWQDQLSQFNYLELEKLGSFRINKEGNLLFEQFNETNFSNSSYGLTTVHASPIERIGLAHRIERGLDNKKASPNILKIIKGTSIAAAVMISVMIGFKLTNNYKTNQSLNLGFSSVIPSKTKVKNDKINITKPIKTKKEQNKIETVLNKDEIQYFKDLGHLKEPENLSKIKQIQAEKSALEAKFKALENSHNNKTKKAQDSSPLKFHVIAGCFGVKANAIKMVEKLKSEGFKNAQLAGKSKSGLLRVSYESFHKKIKALKALAKAKLSHNINAWLAKD